MAGRPYILKETTWKTVARTSYEVAILPWGATEAHNYHLPYGTDSIECGHMAAEAARLAWEAGARVVVLPTIPLGVQTAQLDIPLCLNMNPSTQAAVLGDLARTLSGQGIRKLVIINGHGGNDFRAMVREIQAQVDIFLCVINWYHAVEAEDYFDDPGDHGGELETSVMQHIAPSLVLPLADAGSGTERPFRIAGLREGWAWSPRHWPTISEDTGVGNPHGASVDRGARYTAAVTERIGAFLVELASADLDDLYE